MRKTESKVNSLAMKTPLSFLPGGDDFRQFNAFPGYLWNRNLCEVGTGVLNVGGDYRLSPMIPYPYLKRDQTFAERCRLCL